MWCTQSATMFGMDRFEDIGYLTYASTVESFRRRGDLRSLRTV